MDKEGQFLKKLVLRRWECNRVKLAVKILKAEFRALAFRQSEWNVQRQRSKGETNVKEEEVGRGV